MICAYIHWFVLWLHSNSFLHSWDMNLYRHVNLVTRLLATRFEANQISQLNFHLPRCNSIAISKNFIRQMFFCPIDYIAKEKVFSWLSFRLCIHLIKRGFAKKIAWQMVKRTFHDLWIICAPLNYVWSRIIKKHKTTRASQRRQ